MTAYFSLIWKSYFASYSGLSPQCWQGILLNFVASTLSGVFYFLSLYFVNELHFDIALASLIISAYGLGAILGGFLGGKISDKFPPDIVSSYCLLVLGFAFFILIKLTSAYLLLIDLFIVGLTTYGFLTSNYVWVLNQCNRHESDELKAINILSVISNLGLGLSAVMISFLISYGFHTIFFISGTLLLLSASYFIFSLRNNEKITSPKKNKLTINNIQPSTESIKANKKVISTILICVLLVGIIVAQLSATYAIYIEDIFPQYGVKGVSSLFMLNTLLIVFLQTPLVNLFSHYNKLFMVGIGAFLVGLGMIVLAFSHLFIIAIFSCIIYTFGEMLFFSIAQLVCYQKGDAHKKGQSLGIFRMIFAASRVIGPAIGGYIYLHLGGNMLWYLCGFIGLTCLAVCEVFKKYA